MTTERINKTEQTRRLFEGLLRASKVCFFVAHSLLHCTIIPNLPFLFDMGLACPQAQFSWRAQCPAPPACANQHVVQHKPSAKLHMLGFTLCWMAAIQAMHEQRAAGSERQQGRQREGGAAGAQYGARQQAAANEQAQERIGAVLRAAARVHPPWCPTQPRMEAHSNKPTTTCRAGGGLGQGST